MVRKEKISFTRRDFLKGTAFTTLGVALGLVPPETLSYQEGKKERVVLIRDKDVLNDELMVDKNLLSTMLSQGMASLGGEKDPLKVWKGLFNSKDILGVKISVMITPTHNELIELIVRNLLSAGVEDKNIYVWDRDKVGIGSAEMFSRPRSFGFDNDHLSKVIKKCTALINVTGMKSHWLSGAAFSIKNWAGAIDNAFEYHTEDCCSSLGALCAIPEIKSKCRLIILDGLRPLFNGGPQVDPKYLWNYNGLILGKDHVAVDIIALKIIQNKRDEFKKGKWILSPPPIHISLADTKYKAGTGDLNRIELIKSGWQEGMLL
ncbi:MAG: DUF362 domain-containing protein [candidate division Zixibacteria bacterium]|nr:DUF362 domain-containing protein [candidate division Zixibacteria bacterium]